VISHPCSFCLLVCNLAVSTLFAQTKLLDSLKSELPKLEGEDKANTLCEICTEMNYIDPDNARIYCLQGIELAKNLAADAVIAKGYDQLGVGLRSQGLYDSAIQYHLQGLDIRQKLKLKLDIADSYNNMGIAYDEKGHNYKAITYYIDALNIYEEYKYEDGIAMSLNNLAIIYKEMNQYEKALGYYLDALDIYQSLKSDFGVTIITGNIGAVYLKLGEYEKSIEYSQKAANRYKKLHLVKYIPYSLSNLGVAYKELGQLEESLKHDQLALDLHLNYGNKKEVSFTYNNMAQTHFKMGEYKNSIDLAIASLQVAQEIEALDQMINANETLSKCYAALGDYQNGYKYSIAYISHFKSSNKDQKNKQILSLQTEYETAKKEKAIELLSVQNQLKDAEISNANQRFYAAAVGSILLAILGFTLFNRFKHKQQMILAEEKAKNQRLGFKSLIEGEEKERKRIAQELHDGLGQLLSSARLNVSAMEDNFAEAVSVQWNNSIKLIDDAVTEVRTISHNMMPNALISIGFEAAINEQIHIINDAGQVKVHAQFPNEKINVEESEAIALYRIIQEILNNALKYADADNIWVTIEVGEVLTVSIRDDGKGFDTSLIPSSTGIGWKNIMSRVDILNGVLDVESAIGKGSEISLKIAV